MNVRKKTYENVKNVLKYTIVRPLKGRYSVVPVFLWLYLRKAEKLIYHD